MDNASLSNHIFTLEKRLTAIGARQNASELSQLLTDDFVEFGASGRRFNKSDIIALLSSEDDFTPYEICDFKLDPLGTGTVLVTYMIAARTDGHGQSKSGSQRSSIWKLVDDRWQLFFHQGTRISGQ